MSELALQLISKEKKDKSGYLDLGNCGLKPDNPLLKDVWEALSELNDLETLILANTWSLYKEYDWVSSNNNGERNWLDKIPVAMQYLHSLKKLILGHIVMPGEENTDLWEIRILENLNNLTKLEYLDVRNNGISKLQGLESLTNLKSLIIESNQIYKLEGLESLKSLLHLDVSRNKISKIEGLERLKSLQDFNISYNDITKLENLQYLNTIRSLNISRNKISKIEGLDELASLDHFNISDNKIVELEGLNKLTSLQYFDISGNEIQELKGLSELSPLKHFDIGNNLISKLENLDCLKNLEYLDSRSNNINQIGGLNELSNLQHFGISNNPINKLQGIEVLTKLKRLNISKTNITDLSPIKKWILEGIPVERYFATLKDDFWDKGIGIYKCPLTIPPLEVVRQGNEAVLRYFKELESELVIPLLEAKLLIIGSGGVGKTTLSVKLHDPNAELPRDEDTTVGITISEQPKIYTIENKDYTLYMWDFGGQDKYYPAHQFFLTKNSIYVLMQDGREQKTDFYYWLQVQELLASKSPLFIIQNIKHSSRCDIPVNDLKAKFSNVKDYFEVDLSKVKKGYKTFENIENFLKASLQSLPHIGQLWPARRFAIRDALINLKEKQFITYEDYLEICRNHRYTSPQAQKELLQQLHYLGKVLYFGDTPFLEDIIITDPQWVTDAVFAILDHTKSHHEKRGHFNWQDLKEVWQGERYKGMFQQILTLMAKFELCFELPDEKYTYIAPLLLPDDKPEYAWDGNENFQMKYEYDFMPKGILARLIIRLHSYVKGKLFWKRGVILVYKNTEAQVTEDYTGRNLYISVQGSKVNELVFLITTEIDKVNENYHFSDRIKSKKLVPCICSKCLLSTSPHFYDFEILEYRIENLVKKTIECPNSAEDVSVSYLLDSIAGDKNKGASKGQQKEIAEIRELVSKNKIQKAISVLVGLAEKPKNQNIKNKAILISSRFKNEIDEQLFIGKVNQISLNEINRSILSLIDEIK